MKTKKMKHANITVESELWEEFKKLTKENDSDASKEIRKFIKEYLKSMKGENEYG